MSSNHSGTPSTTPDGLIERCLSVDQSAWDTIVRLYWRRVFHVVYTFVGRDDQAEGLTQDIFLRVYRSLNGFDRRANFQSWLISVTRNLCIDTSRSVRREREDRARMLREALERVPPTLRGAVMRGDIHELGHQEIAERLRLPEGTFTSRINRERVELARQIRQLREAQVSRPSAGAQS